MTPTPVIARYVLSVDQGTTSTRAALFDRAGRLVALRQHEHRQHYPQPGWVEHDTLEIWTNLCQLVPATLADAGVGPDEVAAIGIANQRETTVVWERKTGRPIHQAIVWQDTRTSELLESLAADPAAQRVTERCGLPLAPYFSASRLRWILDSVPGARKRAEAGELLFGTIETWLIWNLTGGPSGGLHITDVTGHPRLPVGSGTAGVLRHPDVRASRDPAIHRGPRHLHGATAGRPYRSRAR
jgi:glycerol kinase